MTTPLKPGIEKIMRVFYLNKNKKLHLRELARLTNMYGQSIARYLNQLEKDKILASEKEGNLKKYFLKKSKGVYSFLSLFDVEKFEKLPNIRKTAIDRYLETLDEIPVFAIIFGSTAKETFKDTSDIDILIITNKKIDITGAEKEANAITGIKISTFQMEYQIFLKELKLKEDSVVQSALTSGYPVMNHIRYYDVLNHE